MLDLHALNELRNLILQKAGIKFISPSDCQHIALSISKKVNKTISKTTIKRLFGFAVVKHNFSKFTINTLLEYVDSSDTEIVLKSSVTPIYKKDVEDWKHVALKAKAISQNTLSGIVNHSAIPYKATINRKFAIQDFEYFYKSNFSFTAFISQPGYGNSTLLSHLVQNLFFKPQAKFHNDIVLFINATDVFDKEGNHQSFETEIKKRLNISKSRNLIPALNNHYEKTGNKFVIIIDSFHELFIANKEKSKIFEIIISWLCEIEDSSAIKLVLSMRSYYWVRFYSLMRNSHYLRQKWYSGSYYNHEQASNVPKFTIEEVDLVLNNIDHKAQKKLDLKVKSKLKYPYYFKFYNELREEYPQSEFHTDIIFHEIYLKYILENIYRSNQSLEKLILCKKIIQFSDYGHSNLSVDKKLFFHDFTIFKQAYMELLADGILVEHKQIQNGILIETVGFVHAHIFEYFLFKELLERTQHTMNENFLAEITTAYHPNLSASLLQWSIFTAIRNGNYEVIKLIFKLKLNNQNENYFFLFTLENIKHQLKYKPGDAVQLKKNGLQDQFVTKLVQQDFLSPSFKSIITFFSGMVDNKENAVIYQSILLISDCLNLNLKNIKERLNFFLKLNAITKEWPIDPFETALFINAKLSGDKNINLAFLEKVKTFEINTTEKESYEVSIAQVKRLISYLFILLINELEHNTKGSVHLILSIEKLYPLFAKFYRKYHLYLLYILALETSKNPGSKKAEELERIIEHLNQKSTSKYANAFLMSIKAQQHLNRNEFAKAISYAHKCINYCRENAFSLVTILNFNILIKIYTKLKDLVKVEEYKFLKTMELEKRNITKSLSIT
ncbi:hypothetical protein [Pedobacter sp. Hv1]|uniref:hypothetical protein n=1 Tax=Pedobacter sp. Hv1 TaxID=1740090 RepID=UPI0006D8C49B|nr:hypothetical protein [Pedobacter sp. Hv1]KQC00756.1 hypothetical protein AQF98_08740 [Pedobacter sp. Hv1]